ncbi:universal stress protein [Streptomyces sp. SID161]|uniref:universal stress protein n=1 Tax=Streptomyces sp. SID161 TaxID=2690251 RepID=UPI00136910F8|nr:universal stress protein [Streptomyces sp. SID161]MYW20954.1 universal stress protein [Streptomyces sp. SID2955]MYW42999.1 universal stress protein [Streptomyces sp. SID161]
MSESRPSPAPRVLAGVSGSPGSLTALARAADEARRRGAELWPVLAWEPPAGDLAARRSPVASVMACEWEQLAGERLLGALRTVFGGPGTGLPGRALLVRGAPGPALVRTADRDDDVLVVGAGARGRLRRALWPSVGRYCLAHAGCPVLAVPPSPLRAALAALHRRNALGLRLDTRLLVQERGTVRPDA